MLAAIAVVAVLAVGAMTAACDSTPEQVTTSSVAAPDRVGVTVIAPAQRQRAPDLAGPTIDGPPFQLGSVLGHGVVVVNVWASWCVPCRSESRTLAAMSTSLASRGVKFVGIDEQDSPARARAFARRVKVPYPSLSDPDGRLLAKLTLLPSSGIPSTLVLDKHGLMAGRIVGAVQRASLSRLISRVDSVP